MAVCPNKNRFKYRYLRPGVNSIPKEYCELKEYEYMQGILGCVFLNILDSLQLFKKN